jgi:hypothetical protein
LSGFHHPPKDRSESEKKILDMIAKPRWSFSDYAAAAFSILLIAGTVLWIGSATWNFFRDLLAPQAPMQDTTSAERELFDSEATAIPEIDRRLGESVEVSHQAWILVPTYATGYDVETIPLSTHWKVGCGQLGLNIEFGDEEVRLTDVSLTTNQCKRLSLYLAQKLQSMKEQRQSLSQEGQPAFRDVATSDHSAGGGNYATAPITDSDGSSRDHPAKPTTQADFDKLPSQAWFVNPLTGK